MSGIEEKVTTMMWLKIVLLIISFTSCEGKFDLNGDVVVDPELLYFLYNTADDTILIDNQELVLYTDLFRNFTPGVLPNEKNRRLFAFLYVKSIDSLKITERIKAEKLYIINADKIWISNPSTVENEFNYDFLKKYKSINGPNWDTEILVDVVFKVEDLSTSSFKYIISREQIIQKVW